MCRNPSFFRQLFVATLIALGSNQALALTELSDDSMSGVTGEGIAFLPENLQVVMSQPGANNTNALTDRALDTGYIRLIPVGPLTSAATNNTTYGEFTGKADVFLYGLGISKADGDSNSRLGSAITSWGTSANPWLLKVQTATGVQDFSESNAAGNAVSYLNFEAPLYQPAVDGVAGADAYNLKFSWWADFFNRKPDVVESLTATGTQFDVGGIDRANRLRLQAIWDGLSVNGTNIQLFQTLDGATNSAGMSTSYNNTLGLSAVIRMNSGDSTTLRADATDTITESHSWNSPGGTNGSGDWNNIHGGWNQTLSTAQSGGNCGNGGASGSAIPVSSYSIGCQFMIQSRKRTDTKTRSMSWNAAPSGMKVFRIATAETSATGKLETPAINGTSAPEFASDEGLFLYNPNINLPLGSLQQPLTAGVAADGRNLVLEIARVPNKAQAYDKVYTNYTNPSDILAKNCNVHNCPSTATHGSISIGSTEYNSSTNTLTAYAGVESVGISFGALGPGGPAVGPITTTTETYEVRYKQRRPTVYGWRSDYGCGALWGSCDEYFGSWKQWEYYDGANWTIPDDNNPYYSDSSTCSGGFSGCSVPQNPSDCPNEEACLRYGTSTNRLWYWNSGQGTWLYSRNAVVEDFLSTAGVPDGGNMLTGNYPLPSQNLAPNPAANVSPLNNLGSVVIDGILIQHMKFTTTGL